MGNYNDWNVPFSTITWFLSIVRDHENVTGVTRDRDIMFTIVDKHQGVHKVLLLNEYRFGKARLIQAMNEFSELEHIVIGGNWNRYTEEAKAYGRTNRISIYDFSSFLGALNALNLGGVRR